jgi:5-methyltetrahydropteroyltriglutamate--homocysteine methyltransferase
MLETSIVGSLPKPSWLAQAGLRAPWRLSGDELRAAQDEAVRQAIHDQEEAGLDVVTDGELRRRHYIAGFLDGLTGIDQERTAKKKTRGGRYADAMDVPRIVGELRRPGPVLVEACRKARALTNRTLKVTLPGPMTMADDVADQHYGEDHRSLAMRFAAILNAEARDLADAGADIIQFDEPCFNVLLEEVQQWGMEALERSMDGVRATKAVHICYGYGTPLVLAWKSKNTSWGHYGVTLPLLARSSVAGYKEVAVGVIDVGSEEVETPETVAGRIRRALEYVAPDRLKPSTDCGLVPRTEASARGKMRALSAGAAIVRSELPVSLTPQRQL